MNIYSWYSNSDYTVLILLCYFLKVYVRAGLGHGDQTLCPTTSTSKGASPEKPEWNELLEFDVPIFEMPRSAKLCFIIYQQKQPGRKSKEVKFKFK